MTDLVPKVYTAIAAVAKVVCERGIGKDRRNEQQNYRFRGIDDFYNALAPALAAAHLCILPRCKSRTVVDRTNAKGTALFYVTVEVEYDFVCADDGSKHTVGPFYGEAMDSGDKATNKALSAAYKYCVMQTFAVPIEGQSVDSETQSHGPEIDLDNDVVARFEAAQSTAEVAKAWNAIPRELRSAYRSVKDAALWRVEPQTEQANA